MKVAEDYVNFLTSQQPTLSHTQSFPEGGFEAVPTECSMELRDILKIEQPLLYDDHYDNNLSLNYANSPIDFDQSSYPQLELINIQPTPIQAQQIVPHNQQFPVTNSKNLLDNTTPTLGRIGRLRNSKRKIFDAFPTPETPSDIMPTKRARTIYNSSTTPKATISSETPKPRRSNRSKQQDKNPHVVSDERKLVPKSREGVQRIKHKPRIILRLKFSRPYLCEPLPPDVIAMFRSANKLNPREDMRAELLLGPGYLPVIPAGFTQYIVRPIMSLQMDQKDIRNAISWGLGNETFPPKKVSRTGEETFLPTTSAYRSKTKRLMSRTPRRPPPINLDEQYKSLLKAQQRIYKRTNPTTKPNLPPTTYHLNLPSLPTNIEKLSFLNHNHKNGVIVLQLHKGKLLLNKSIPSVKVMLTRLNTSSI
jgi:hypothetical protein